MSTAVERLLARLADAERRLAEHAAAPLPSGLTDPDPGGVERWEAGQVWAHLAEFPGYWLGQLRHVVENAGNDPVPFGRTKTDPRRIRAIEVDRHTDPAALLERVSTPLAELTDEVRSFGDEAWRMRGLHPTLGAMSVQHIVERFIVEHLEEHADQLDRLAHPE